MIRIQKVLCPVDFFPGSLRAFDYALKLAKNYDAAIVAMHVVAVPVVPPTYDAAANLPDLTTELEKESRRLLENLRDKAGAADVALETDVRFGDVDLEIRDAVNDWKADLVVMGTHGRRGFERWFLGSTTERLIRHCPVPLLVVGGEHIPDAAPPEIRRILVTTDFSDGTAEALNYAFSIAQESEADIDLLHVIDDQAFTDVTSDLREEVIENLRKKVDALVPEEAKAWCNTSTTVTTGSPYQEILKTAKKDNVDLLVMNIHGKGFIDRALVGTHAERVLRAADCPVLLIPPARKASSGTKKGGRAA
jgi:nucleotide-binding universal stress UspA family protein